MTSTTLASIYEVAVTYCNGISFVHNHDDAQSACSEYAGMIAKGLVPELIDQEPGIDKENFRHVRMVSMLRFNEDGTVGRHINSDVFPCEHNQSKGMDEITIS
jgi:hypothetical protein